VVMPLFVVVRRLSYRTIERTIEQSTPYGVQ
jgi:hypothetical protein